jgi:hypothetical protein
MKIIKKVYSNKRVAKIMLQLFNGPKFEYILVNKTKIDKWSISQICKQLQDKDLVEIKPIKEGRLIKKEIRLTELWISKLFLIYLSKEIFVVKDDLLHLMHNYSKLEMFLKKWIKFESQTEKEVDFGREFEKLLKESLEFCMMYKLDLSNESKYPLDVLHRLAAIYDVHLVQNVPNTNSIGSFLKEQYGVPTTKWKFP